MPFALFSIQKTEWQVLHTTLFNSTHFATEFLKEIFSILMHWEKKQKEKSWIPRLTPFGITADFPLGEGQSNQLGETLKPLENYNKLTKDLLTFLAAVPDFQM